MRVKLGQQIREVLDQRLPFVSIPYTAARRGWVSMHTLSAGFGSAFWTFLSAVLFGHRGVHASAASLNEMRCGPTRKRKSFSR